MLFRSPETNVVVLGLKEELKRQNMLVGKMNFIKYDRFPENTNLLVKVRYKDAGVFCEVFPQDDHYLVNFCDEVSAVAPGQSAVFYEGNDVVGGGIILK